jgi:hypothetical protein
MVPLSQTRCWGSRRSWAAQIANVYIRRCPPFCKPSISAIKATLFTQYSFPPTLLKKMTLVLFILMEDDLVPSSGVKPDLSKPIVLAQDWFQLQSAQAI